MNGEAASSATRSDRSALRSAVPLTTEVNYRVCRGQDGCFGMILYIDVDPFVVKWAGPNSSHAELRVNDAVLSVNGERHVGSIRREFATARVLIIRVARPARFCTLD